MKEWGFEIPKFFAGSLICVLNYVKKRPAKSGAKFNRCHHLISFQITPSVFVCIYSRQPESWSSLNIWRQALPSRSTSGSRPVAEAHPCLDFPFPQWPFLHGTLYRPDKYMVRNKTEREHPNEYVFCLINQRHLSDRQHNRKPPS